jgi:hypothetical protein
MPAHLTHIKKLLLKEKDWNLEVTKYELKLESDEIIIFSERKVNKVGKYKW